MSKAKLQYPGCCTSFFEKQVTVSNGHGRTRYGTALRNDHTSARNSHAVDGHLVVDQVRPVDLLPLVEVEPAHVPFIEACMCEERGRHRALRRANVALVLVLSMGRVSELVMYTQLE